MTLSGAVAVAVAATPAAGDRDAQCQEHTEPEPFGRVPGERAVIGSIGYLVRGTKRLSYSAHGQRRRCVEEFT